MVSLRIYILFGVALGMLFVGPVEREFFLWLPQKKLPPSGA